METTLKQDMVKYFGSLESALTFYKDKLEKRKNDLYNSRNALRRDFFGRDFYNQSINNKQVTDLIERFQDDVCKVLEVQVEETQSMVNAIESIKRNEQ